MTPPASARARSRSQSRRGLTRAAVVDAAEAVLAEAGLDGLTMRAVAARLGVGTMTLYGHVRDKDELLDAIIDAKNAELEIPRPAGSWRERLRALMIALHEQLVEHPFLVQLRLRRPLISPGALRWTEAGLEALVDAGLTPGQAAQAFRPLFVYTFAHVGFLPHGEPDVLVREVQATIVRLSPDEYPIVTRAAGDLAQTLVGSEAYEYGLDRLLDGIEAQLTRP